MRRDKSLIAVVTLIFTFMAAPPAHALWGDSQSKLSKDSYEHMIRKNLELRQEVDSLLRSQEQLKDIYRLLLEKVKVLQRDKTLLLTDKGSLKAAETERKAAIETLTKELASARERVSDMESLMNTTGTAIKSGTDAYYKKSIVTLKNSLDASDRKYRDAVAEKQALEKELKGMQDKIGEQNENTKKLTSDLRSHYGKAEEESRKVRDLSEELSSAIDKQEKAAKELREMRKNLEAKDAELKAQYAKAAEYEEAMKKAEELKKSYEAKESELSGESKKILEGKDSALKDKEAELQKIALERDNAAKELEEARKSLEAKDSELKAQSSKTAEYEEAAKKAEDLKKSYEAKQNEAVLELKKTLEDKDAELKEKDGGLKDRGAELKKMALERDNAAKELEEARKTLDDKSSELKAQYARLAKREKAASKKTLELKKSYEAKESELAASLKRSLEEKDAGLKAKEDELKKLAAERDNAESRVKSLEESLASSGSYLKKYERRFKEEARKIKELKSGLDSAGSALKAREKELEDLSSVRRMQDERLKELTKGISEGKDFTDAQSKRLKSQGERIKDLQAAISLINKSLRTADLELRAKKEEEKKLEGIFDKGSLQKKYPEAFGKSDAEKFRDSPAVRRVREAMARLDARRKAKEEEFELINKDMNKAVIDAKALRDKMRSADGDIEKAKRSIEDVNSASKKALEEAAAGEEKLKTLQDAFEKALAEQKEADAKLELAIKKSADTQVALKKLMANPLQKGAVAAGKSREMAGLEKEIVRDKADEDSLREAARNAENNSRKLEVAVNELQPKPKEEAAAKAASDKEKIHALIKDIEKARADKHALNKGFQHLKKKGELCKARQGVLLEGIRSDESEILGLKSIIEREMAQISATEAAAPVETEKGLVGRADKTLSKLRDEIKELKARNESLKKDVHAAKEAEKSARRKAEAEAKLPKALKEKVDKERLDMHYNLAVVYDTNGMYKDAEREYLKCLEIDPNDAGVHYNLGVLYDDKLNDNHKAIQHYRKYLDVRPMGDNISQVRQWITDIELQERLGNETR